MERIVRWSLPPEGTRWSVVTQLMGMGVLLDLPLGAENRSRLARILPRPRAMEVVTIQILGYRRQSGDRSTGPYIMGQIYHRLLKHSLRVDQRLRFLVYRYLFLALPGVGLALFRAAIRISGRGKELLNVRDPFNRG